MEFKPCPFCGAKPVLIVKKPGKPEPYSLVCRNLDCPMLQVATYWYATEDEANAAWNTRTGDAE